MKKHFVGVIFLLTVVVVWQSVFAIATYAYARVVFTGYQDRGLVQELAGRVVRVYYKSGQPIRRTYEFKAQCGVQVRLVAAFGADGFHARSFVRDRLPNCHVS